MASIFKKRSVECTKIGEEEDKTKYVCRTEEGKEHLVTVGKNGSVQLMPSIVLPSRDEYARIVQALKEKGEPVI